jgi:hypothetical protein
MASRTQKQGLGRSKHSIARRPRRTRRCRGEIVHIDGRDWCVGEKIISKWKYSKLNKKSDKK